MRDERLLVGVPREAFPGETRVALVPAVTGAGSRSSEDLSGRDAGRPDRRRDMPTVISLPNSYAGLSASMMGLVLDNKLLIIADALDGSSGLILSIIMCRAMNRSFTNVLVGGFGAKEAVGAIESRPVRSVEPQETKYAIHPVAGRMPDHMNLLLPAERPTRPAFRSRRDQPGVSRDRRLHLDKTQMLFGDAKKVVGEAGDESSKLPTKEVALR